MCVDLCLFSAGIFARVMCIVLLVSCAVFLLLDSAVCSTLLAPLVAGAAGASRPLGSLREPYGVPCNR